MATWVEEIWKSTPRKGRERSSQKDLQRALAAAVRRGHRPEAIAAALRAYYASPDATKDGGEFARGVHRLIQEDRWATWAPTIKAAVASDPSSWSEERWATTVRRWRETGHWPGGIGPPPDQPGSLAPAQAPPLLRVIA
ncbi:hypothetical protein [Caulobacter sp. CCG-8]|uniref:hypothetical protein n=1 Tax=Caulobacter sp. CCG-8 TaxID=3127958 RepID=UPI00307E542B